MQAIMTTDSRDNQQMELLHDAECHLIDAIATAQETIARCEQALASLAEARSRNAERLSSPLAAAGLAPVTGTQNGHRCQVAPYRTDNLTAREFEVLRLIAAGHSNRQIADMLFLSPRTVERHIANIYLKIDAHSKAEATAYVRRHCLA
jgi:DNA-binding NarL/FixJ family response regulator